MPLIPYFSQSPFVRVRTRSPWQEEPQISELLRTFWGVDSDAPASAWAPRLDVHESKEAYRIQADLPGVDKKDIQVSLENGVLTLKGGRQTLRESQAQDGTWHRHERHSGSFARSLNLGDGVDVEQIKAEVKDGVLTVTVPKKEAIKAKVVPIA